MQRVGFIRGSSAKIGTPKEPIILRRTHVPVGLLVLKGEWECAIGCCKGGYIRGLYRGSYGDLLPHENPKRETLNLKPYPKSSC